MIKELNEFSKELKLYRESTVLPQGDVKNKLADIYEANWHNNKRWGAAKIDRGCPTCVSDMMKSLCEAWYNSLKEFKGVPQVEQRDLEDQIAEEETEVEVSLEYSKMNREQLIDLCETLGIKYHHKNKRDTLLKKVENYFNG
jgi:hypothetical protein